MDMIYQIALISSMLVGVGLMAYALFIGRKSIDDDDRLNHSDGWSFAAASDEESAKMEGELHEISNHIFEELETKHNELLALYKLVDKKKKELDSTYEAKPEYNGAKPEYRKPYEELVPDGSGGKTANFAVSTANIRKVRQLQQEGFSIDEISNELGIGKNEVKLMLDLGKIR